MTVPNQPTEAQDEDDRLVSIAPAPAGTWAVTRHGKTWSRRAVVALGVTFDGTGVVLVGGSGYALAPPRGIDVEILTDEQFDRCMCERPGTPMYGTDALFCQTCGGVRYDHSARMRAA